MVKERRKYSEPRNHFLLSSLSTLSSFLDAFLFVCFHCHHPALGPYFHIPTSSVSSLIAVLQGLHQTNFPEESSHCVLAHQKQLQNWTNTGGNVNCFQALGNKQHRAVILKRNTFITQLSAGRHFLDHSEVI